MGFFNYNFKMSHKSQHHLKKVQKLIKLIPPQKELRYALKNAMKTKKGKDSDK